jgi:radical SAM superfamily enzyme YgiQ (UPF0313 family)
MIGLPSETIDDVKGIVELVNKIYLTGKKIRNKAPAIRVSISTFVPKPHTPFQWAAMAPLNELKARIKHIKSALQRVPNVRVHSDLPRWAYIQALLARGDRRVAGLLYLVDAAAGNWAHALKTSPINPDFYVLRERDPQEILPWDFIDHRISKTYLLKEYRLALEGRPGHVCRVDSCRLCGACGEAPSGKQALQSA